MPDTGAIIFPSFQRKLSVIPYDWTGDTLRIALLDSAPRLGDEWFRHVAHREVSGDGYERGGQLLRNQYVRLIDNQYHFYAADVHWRTKFLEADHAVIYSDGVTRPLLAWIDFGKRVTASKGLFRRGKANFRVTWDSAGIISLDHQCCIRFPHEVQR